MSLMKIDVLHIAKLANLPLKEDEIKKYEEQLLEILEYIEVQIGRASCRERV